MKNSFPIIVVSLLILVLFGGYFYNRNKEISKTKVETNSSTSRSTSETSSSNNLAYESINSKPIQLTLISPTTGATVTSATLKVSGTTAPDAEVFVNEHETKSNSSGEFNVTVTLTEGENYFIVFANDSEGNAVEKEFTVNYSNPN